LALISMPMFLKRFILPILLFPLDLILVFLLQLNLFTPRFLTLYFFLLRALITFSLNQWCNRRFQLLPSISRVFLLFHLLHYPICSGIGLLLIPVIRLRNIQLRLNKKSRVLRLPLKEISMGSTIAKK